MRALLILALAGSIYGGAALAAPPTPAMLAASCTGCHGGQGNSAGPSIPTIAGYDAKYLEDAMRKFKSVERPSTLMGRLAKGYSDADFAAMAEFFSAQKRVSAKQATDPAKAARGKEVHDKHCKKCHQDNGREFAFNEAPGPILAGQWLEYLRISMNEFFSRDRDMHTKMGEAMLNVGGNDAEALVHFYASQQ